MCLSLFKHAILVILLFGHLVVVSPPFTFSFVDKFLVNFEMQDIHYMQRHTDEGISCYETGLSFLEEPPISLISIHSNLLQL